MNKFHIFSAVVFFCMATTLHAEPDSLNNVRREIVFHKMSTGNYLLREEPENSSCLRYVDGDSRNMLIRPGNSTIRAYKRTTDACAFEPQRIKWIVTTTRKADHMEIQCRVSVIVDRIDNRWSTQVKTESYGPDDDHLCTRTTLIKSAACVLRVGDSPDRHSMNCLNQFVPGRFREIEVTLDGPDFDASYAQLSNPFDSQASVHPVPSKRNLSCRFKFCRIFSREEAEVK